MSQPACIVIPTFNGARRLPLVLDALATQDAPTGLFEVVVVDNASTDETAKIAKSLSSSGDAQSPGGSLLLCK
jgi:glycosyltransferase involved in cell wall biosynthesis